MNKPLAKSTANLSPPMRIWLPGHKDNVEIIRPALMPLLPEMISGARGYFFTDGSFMMGKE